MRVNGTAVILFHFLAELRANDRRLEAARKETTEILDTVSEGLFLLDDNQKIAGQHSACLPALFGRESVAELTFSELIQDLVKPKDLETAQRFIALLFRPDIKSNLIQDLNPLNEVEMQIPAKEGGVKTSYLNFDFTRVQSEMGNSVLVTVNDVTRSIKLEAELAQEKARNEQQLEMLTGILHTDHTALRSFTDTAFIRFDQINQILRDQTKTQESFSRKLEKIFIEVHSFKGDASALGLDSFADYAHRFEQQINQIKSMPKITGNDFLGLTVHLEGLIRYTEEIQGIAGKLSKFASVNQPLESNPTTERAAKWQKLTDLAGAIALRENKQANVVLSRMSEVPLSAETEMLVNDLCVQFIRNAIVHSIEPSDQREQSSKAPAGRVDVHLLTLPNGDLELSIADDGEGINFDKIRQQAQNLNQWDSSLVESWDHKKLLGLIFKPGFSTAENPGQDAGQGVGMNVIRERIIQAGGHLKVSNRSGTGCKFIVTLPRSSQKELAA